MAVLIIMTDVPRTALDDQMDDMNEDEDLIPPDERRPQRLLDSLRQADGELSDSDDEGEGDRRDHKSHRDPDSVNVSGTKRLPVGIMSAGSTHGMGPTVPQPVINAVVAASASSAAQSDMEVDDDEPPLAETLKAKTKARGSDAMVVDTPAPEQPTSSTSTAAANPVTAPTSTS